MSSKHDRLVELRNAGLNTPKFWFIPEYPSDDNIDLSSELRDSIDFGRAKYLSIRAQVPGGSVGKENTPHFPNLEFDAAVMKVLELRDKGFEVIIQEGINPEDSLMCGTCWLIDPEHSLLEIAVGSGYTVRRVTRDGYFDLSVKVTGPVYSIAPNSSVLFHSTIDSICRRVVEEARKFKKEKVIFEWSFYNHGIGNRSDPLIFWEYTIDGSNGFLVANDSRLD